MITKRVIVFLVFLVIAAGIYVRFDFLGKHFSHVDDLGPLVTFIKFHPDNVKNRVELYRKNPEMVFISGLWERYTQFEKIVGRETAASFISSKNPFSFAYMISKNWTYAPLQYLFYPVFLHHSDYPYQEFLLRGRLTSALAGSLSLILFTFIYLKWNGSLEFSFLPGIGLFSFSLMNVIYSKQMSSYEIGVLFVLALIYFLFRSVNNLHAGWNFLVFALICSLASHANYQVLFMVPIAYFVLWFAIDKKQPGSVKKFFCSFVIYCLSVLPLYFIFLRFKLRGGTPMFINMENYLPDYSSSGFLSNIAINLVRLIKNLYEVFENNILVVEQGTILANILVMLGMVCAFFGFAQMARDESPRAKLFVRFSSLVLFSWIFGYLRKKFVLSPTRHTLLLSPFIFFYFTFGFKYLMEVFLKNRNVRNIASFVLSLFFALSFLGGYASFREKRIDQFSAETLEKVMGEKGLNVIVGCSWTWQPYILFRSSHKPYEVYLEFEQDDLSRYGKKFLLVSHRNNKDVENALEVLSGKGYSASLVLSKNSDTEICLSNKTANGGNALYLWVVMGPEG